MNDKEIPIVAEAEDAEMIERGRRIEECFRLTMEWWEKHDPEAAHAPFRRDIARVIRRRS